MTAADLTPALGPGRALLTVRRTSHMGFLQAADVTVIATDPQTRLQPLLVRCGGCRFIAPADQVQHLIDIITREGSDYVRDVSVND